MSTALGFLAIFIGTVMGAYAVRECWRCRRSKQDRKRFEEWR